MRGAFTRIRPRQLAITILIMLVILIAWLLQSESPDPEAHAEYLGFDDGFCGPGWTHRDPSTPYAINDGSGAFVRVGIKSASGCAVYTTNGASTNGCYSIAGIGTSAITVTKISTGPGCAPIGYIVAELIPTPPTPVVGDDTPTPTSTPSPTSTSTSTPTRTPTPAPFITQTMTPTQIERDGSPSPTATSLTGTPTGENSLAATPQPVDDRTATPTDVSDGFIPLIPVTGDDTCCQDWLILTVLILVLGILNLAALIVLALYLRRGKTTQK